MPVFRRGRLAVAAVQRLIARAAIGPPLLGLVTVAALASPAAAAERLPLRVYTTADGLAHDNVIRMVRDSRGFLWFCTADGLSRFDGYSFVTFGVDQGLPHARVNDFLETRGGEYWVATQAGVARFDPRGRPRDVSGPASDAAMFTVVEQPAGGLREKAVTVLREAKDGTIWVGTLDGLFQLPRRSRSVLERVDVGIPHVSPDARIINDILEDESRSLWIATPNGLFRRQPDGRAVHFTVADGMPGHIVSDLLHDREGRLWAATRTNGFFEFSAGSGDGARLIVGERYDKPVLPTEWVFHLFQGADGRFWLATARGLVEFVRPTEDEPARFRTHSVHNGLTYHDVTALTEDTGGNLWLATNRAGAMRLARHGLTSYGERDGISQITAIVGGSGDSLCFRAVMLPSADGRADYLRRYGCFDGGAFRWFMPSAIRDPGWVGERIITRTRAGEWWLGTGSGVYRFGAGHDFMDLDRAVPAAVYAPEHGLTAWQVFRLFEDAGGNVWIATIDSLGNGLARWERATGRVRDLAHSPGLPSLDDELPRAFAEDRRGQVWIGFNAGLARYTNGRFTYFTAREGLPRGAVMDIHVDAAGRVWLASSGSGLIRVDGAETKRPTFVAHTTAQGFSSNNLEVITEDAAGHIYVGGGRGLDRFDPATGRLKHFTMADGLPHGSFRAAFRDARGVLWFGMSTGLARLVPADDRSSPPPSVMVRAVRIAGVARRVSAVGETDLPLADFASGQDSVEIDFGGFNFRVGETLRYQYRLEGANEAWSVAGDRRTVTYASLRPGRYRFVVQAMDADGGVSSQPAAVSFRILPPIWRRWWFLLLFALASAAVVHTAYRYRVSRLLEMAHMRTRIATDLHDDIGANLTRIALLTEVVKRPDDAEVESHLASIARIARESVSSMSDIVWAINPARETLLDLTRRLRSHAEEMFTLREIDMRFQTTGIREGVRLGVDVRRDLLLIFKEAVNNAARHSDCTRVDIQLVLDGSHLSLTIADNGRGFDSARPAEGQGLTSMARRARRLSGRLEIVSAPGHGPTVRADVPL